MRIIEVKNGEGTIEIDGNEMVTLIESLQECDFGGNTREKLINDITGLYSISVYGKMPQIAFKEKPMVKETPKEGAEK